MFDRRILPGLRATFAVVAALLFNIVAASSAPVQARRNIINSNPQSEFQVTSTGMKADANEKMRSAQP